MRRVSVLLVGLLAACSTSHDPSPITDASMADAVVPSDAGSAVDAPELVIPDASTPDSGLAEVDGGVQDLGDPSCAPDGAPPPRFRELYANVISANGCGSTCHDGAGSHGTTTLDLSTAEVAYRSLVNVLGCDDVRDRVTPCRPEESTLSVVPSLREEPCGGRHTFAGGSVTEEEAEQIDEWIRTGAAW